MDGLVGVLAAVGDLAGGLVSALVTETAFGAGLLTAGAFGPSLPATTFTGAAPWPATAPLRGSALPPPAAPAPVIPPLVAPPLVAPPLVAAPLTAGALVGTALAGGLPEAGLLSPPWLFSLKLDTALWLLAVAFSVLFSLALLWLSPGVVLPFASAERPVASCDGDCGIGSMASPALVVRSNLSLKMFVFSWRAGGGVSPSVSPLSVRRSEGTESLLCSLCRPIRPSFSMAMKFVRTFESGRGDSDGVMDRGARGRGRG